MQSILQLALSRFATDKFLNSLQLFLIANFESTAYVENITVVFREDEFVLYVMQATLQVGLAVSKMDKRAQPPTGRVEPG